MHRPKLFALWSAAAILLPARGAPAVWEPGGPEPVWAAPYRFRVLLEVSLQGRECSQRPASVELDLRQALRDCGVTGDLDEDTLEVIPTGSPGRRVPHRLDRLFGASQAVLHFVVPDAATTHFAVYFDTRESGLGQPGRHPGLVGDGDRFREGHGRRQIAASHFDCFADFDGDGDLDLFQGGVEPFVYCFENVGNNRLVDRGRLTSGGVRFQLPCSSARRSWVTVAFHDLDGDGDLDFFPSFGDGPDAGRIIHYENTTREHDGQLTFKRLGPLRTTSGSLIAGGAQAGGWFPSITFVEDWDGDGNGPDALVGSNNRCWLYRGAGRKADGILRFRDATAVQAAGRDIELVNPRFEVADVDGDGDLDLFAGTQPGPVLWFLNAGSRTHPVLAAGKVIAWEGKYLVGDAHSGVKVADLDGDALPDVASGRFWERADLNHPAPPRTFGGFFKNVGTRRAPRFKLQRRGGPFTEQSQICDAIRQNSVRTSDWDNDGRLDLLAGDTDGFIWFFRNLGDGQFPVFAPGQRLSIEGKPLSVATSGGHARLDVCDWNNDGQRDLVVADGSGTVTLFLNHGRKTRPRLSAGTRLRANSTPIQVGGRASVLVCDWNNDGRKDLLLADDQGYYACLNTGSDAHPDMKTPEPILFSGRKASYVRPNLGAFVDWDGDGRRDLIGCHFENSVRFYRNVGSGAPGSEPRFTDPEGVVILQAESPQMISGAEVLDWDGDGDLDLLTGQGHGGSGLRFYERDWLEDERQGAHPAVNVVGVQMKPRR